MASRTDVLRRGRDVAEALIAGEITNEDITPRGHIALSLARNEIRFEDLTDDEIDLVGLDRPLGQRIGRALAAMPGALARDITQTVPRALGAAAEVVRTRVLPDIARGFAAPRDASDVGPAEALGRAARYGHYYAQHAATAPESEAILITPQLRKVLPSILQPPGGPVDLLAELERGVAVPFAAAGGVARGLMADEPMRQTFGPMVDVGLMTGRVPVLGAPSVAVPRVPLRRPAQRPAPNIEPEPPPPPPPQALRPLTLAEQARAAAPTSLRGLDIIDREGRVIRIEPPPEPQALGPAPPRPTRGFVEERPILLEPGEVTPTVPGLVDAQGRPITEPSPAPSLTERERLRRLERRPIGAPGRREVEPPPTPPGEPTGELSTAGEIAARRAQEAPSAPAPAPQPEFVPPPGAAPLATGVEAPKPTRRPAPRRSDVGVDVHNVNLADPDEVEALVRGRGGIKFTGGEQEGIPFRLVNQRGGYALDELAQEIADAQGRRPREVERELMRAMGRMEKRRAQAGSGVEDPARAKKVPVWLEGVSQGEWESMTIGERHGLIKFWTAMDEGYRREGESGGFSGIVPPIPLPPASEEERGTLKGWIKDVASILGLSVPVVAMAYRKYRAPRPGGPGEPRYEPTRLGDQAVVPGTPTRQMPDTKVTAEKPQRPIEETPLFGQEKVARERASDAAQGALFAPAAADKPVSSGIRWRYGRGKEGLTALGSEDGRFRVEQVSPDEWVARDSHTNAETRTPSFDAARRWAQARLAGATAGAATLPALEEAFTPPPGPEPRLFAEHEQSETIERDGRWYNVYGRGTPLAGEALPPQFPYEKESYDSREQAEDAARRRSDDTPPDHVGPVLVAGLGIPRIPPRIPRGPRPVEPPSVPGRPPEVPSQFRRETIRPQAPPGPVAPPEPALPSPSPATADIVRGVEEVVSRVRAPRVELPLGVEPPPGIRRGGEVPPGGRPPSPPMMPSEIPGDPFPEATRTAQFFGRFKAESGLARFLPPEEVVRGDPAGTAVVRHTIRASSDQALLERELLEQTRELYRGLTPGEVIAVNRVLDTPGADSAAIRRLLPPKLAAVAERVRTEKFDAVADATGIPRDQRITGYYPRFRDTVEIEKTRLVLKPSGVPYLSEHTRTSLEGMPKHYEAFFVKPRTANDPASRIGIDGVFVFDRAAARHLTLNGGFHPVTGEAIPGFLNELQSLLGKGQPNENLQPYIIELVNFYLGTPGSRGGTALQNQMSRIARNVEAARLMGASLSSPIANTTQQINTLAHVRPDSWLRGYRDLLDPGRRELARRYVGGEGLSKAELEIIRGSASKLDRLESLSAKTAEVSLTLFRASEEKGNRYHAFLAGLREADRLGIPGRAAIEFARDIVDVAQFPGTGPAKIAAFRGPFGAAFGQFKQFQIRQTTHFKNIFYDDVKDWLAAVKHGKTEVPVMIRGKVYRGEDGQPVMRPLGDFGTRYLPFHRTAKWLVGMTAVGGPDAIFPGLDQFLEEQGVKVPGLLPAIGLGVSQLMGYGIVDPGDFTRSILFFLPGPVIGHAQDMASALSGVNYGHGLTEMVRGELGTPLSVDERADRALRGFLPVAGVAAARVRKAAKQIQTPGEERAARTILEALGLTPATGPLRARTGPLDPLAAVIGLPTEARDREREVRSDLMESKAVRDRAVGLAADDMAAGDSTRAQARLREAERQLGLPEGSIRLTPEAVRAARQRQQMTPLERQQRQLRRVLPSEVERSRRRFQPPPGAEGR